jgi:hypothetical protein
VNVSQNRMTLDDPTHHAELQKWPDGSKPDEGPGPVNGVDNIPQWKSTLKDAIKAMQFTAIRIQLYGRGTYPVITLSGWRDPILRDTPIEALHEPARKLCAANGNRPLALFGGLDRVNLLRIDCPDKARWEVLR